MKKLIYGGMFLALVGIGAVGCKKESVFESNEKIATSITDSNQQKSSASIKAILEQNPERVGEIHNETLGFVYDQLFNLSFDARNNMTKHELFNFTKDKSIEYLITHTGEDLSYEEINGFISSANTNFEITNKEIVQDYIDQFYIGEEEITLSFHTKKINKVINEASLDYKLSSEDLNQIIAIGSVAKNSHQYWESNSNAWYSLFNIPKALRPGYKGRVVDADISGGVKGFLTGWAGSGGNPLGGLLGSMLGAPVSSAWQGVTEWWNS